MFNSGKSPPNRAQSTVESSLHGLASVLALIAALLTSGQVYEYSAAPVFNYLYESYGDAAFAQLGMWGWVALATAGIFYLARALLVLALLLIAQRLLVLAF